MDNLIPDDLSIPEFLKREMPAGEVKPAVRRRRTGKIAYPRDGYACKGLGEAAREKHRARLRRRAERMREYRPRKRRSK
jgi:hypothetical protein